MQVQVRINEEGALRNLRYAFTDKFTLLSELMQNGRRAGARRIEISYEEESRILRVVDDGCGFDNFQKLLTFNESGWDEATCFEERPFGIGFSKCLYSATRCILVSSGQKIDFLTEDALNRHPIDVHSVNHRYGTIVELHGVELPGLRGRLETMCSGFPIQVWFNGCEMPRPYAIGHLLFKPAPIGQVYLVGTRDGRHASTNLVFLQGFCVMKPGHCDAARINVVHLDSKEFMARLPDHDMLIDEDDQRKRIHACLRSLWRQILQDAKASMSAEAFVETFYEAMRAWGHRDLLDDVPVLPTALCERIVGYPIQEGYEERDYLEPAQVAVTRRDIEEGNVKLIDLDHVNEENAVQWMFARAKAYIVISAVSLHNNHWVQPYVRTIDEEKIHVEAIGEQCRAEFKGRWIWPQVILCHAVAVTVGDQRVEITDAGVYHAGSIFIPACERSGEPVRQVSSFMDGNDRFLDADLDADRDALADLIRRLRSVDPQATLDSMLQELNLEKYPLLRGKIFRLSIGHDNKGHVVELIA